MGNLSSILSLIKNIEPRNVIDILIVAYIFYKILMLIRETRAEQLIKGLILVIVVMKLSQILGFVTLYWIIQNTLTVGLIAVIIIFQPELRKALEHLGRSRFFTKKFFESEEEMERIVNEIAIAASNLSSSKTGALIVIEQETGLSDYAQSGVKLDAIVSSSLLENIFFENSPLHDGAVIIRRDRIYAAGCVMPLTEQIVSKELGTRHRAAIGISENSDAISIVVSEETGIISLAINGKLTRNYDAERLKIVLKKLFKRKMESYNTMFKRVKMWVTKTKNK